MQDKLALLNQLDGAIETRILGYVSRPQGDLFSLFEDVVYQDDLEAFTALLDAGADVNLQQAKYGWTLLHITIRRGRDAMVQLLIDKGADLNRIDGVGWTPLMESIMDDKPALCKLLLEHGADKAITNKRGATAAMLVKKFERTDMMELF